MKALNILVKKPIMAEACIFCEEDETSLAITGQGDNYVLCGNCLAQGPKNADAQTAVELWNEALHRQQRKANAGKVEVAVELPPIPDIKLP